jgi:AcrR family transcriptional regulator
MPAEKRRQQLLQAAKRLFIKKGYRGTTTEEIARRAKLTKGALYYHFASKEDILLALVHDTSCEYDEVLREVCQPGASPLDLLSALFSVHQREDMAEFRNMIDLWVQAMRIPRIKKQMDKFFEDAIGAFADCLDTRYGSDRDSRYQIAVMIGALYDGLAVRKSMRPQAIDIPAQLALFENLQKGLEQGTRRKGKGGRDSN